MKKLLIFLFLCICLCTNAQEYMPVLKEGRTWVYLITDVHLPNYYFFRTATVKGDTIIDGEKCKKVHYCEWDGREYGVWYFLEEDGKVYSFSKEKGRELRMDINLHAGDVVDATPYSKCSVKSEDTIEVRGIKRKRLKVQEGSLYGYWVEGIGWSNEDVTLNPPTSSWGATCYTYECYDNGELIFSMKDFDSSTVTDIDAASVGASTDGKIYDINGMPVETPEKGRIYIRNGKKFVK